MHTRSTRTVTATPCSPPPSELPKVAIPSYLHPISPPAVGEIDIHTPKNNKGGCQLKPADLPCTAAPSRGSFFRHRVGSSLFLATHTPAIPKRNPNRIFPLTPPISFCVWSGGPLPA